MPASARSIALIGFDEADGRPLEGAFRKQGAGEIENVSAPLSAINGRALRLSAKHDLIVFRTEAGSPGDLAAIAEIRRAEPRARIVALTEGSASLDAAHRLTRAGADEVLPDTMSPAEISDYLQQRLGAAGQRKGRAPIVSVAQSRGGVGSTTVAVNLADALLDRKGWMNRTAGARVALVDLDLQYGAVASFLDVPAADALFELARDGTLPDATFLEQSMVTLPSGLSVLAAPSQLAPLDALRPEQVSAILDTLAGSHDFVVVDLPRSLVHWIAPIVEQSDRMLMVTDTTVPAIQRARRLIDFFAADNPGLQVDIVVNHERKPMVRARHHAEAARLLQRPLDIWLPDDPRVAREAIDRGVPLSEISSRAPLSRAFRKLGRDLRTSLSAPRPFE